MKISAYGCLMDVLGTYRLTDYIFCESGAYDVPITEEGTKKVAILGH